MDFTLRGLNRIPEKKNKHYINGMFSIPDLKIRGSNSLFAMCC